MCAQLIGVFVYWLGLRPDPLQVAQHQAAVKADNTQLRRRGWSILKNTPIARRAVLTVALTHLYMVSLMSMTPIHMQHQGASLTLIGITISIHVAGMYALSPVFGWLTDKAGPRTIIFAGQALLITASVLVWSNGQSHTVTTLALLSLGLGWSAATVAGATMITGAVGIAERPQLPGYFGSLHEFSWCSRRSLCRSNSGCRRIPRTGSGVADLRDGHDRREFEIQQL